MTVNKYCIIYIIYRIISYIIISYISYILSYIYNMYQIILYIKSYHISYQILYRITKGVSENQLSRQRFASVPQTTTGAALTCSMAR